MALIGNILKTAFNIGKGVLGLKVAEATGVPVATVEQVFKKAQEIADSDKEIQLAWLEAEKEIFGSYAELKTTFEKVIRSVIRPVVTLTFTALDAWTIISKQPFTKELWILSLLTIGSWFGQKLFTNVKDAFGGNNAR